MGEGGNESKGSDGNDGLAVGSYAFSKGIIFTSGTSV
jgi:hypothetical protein